MCTQIQNFSSVNNADEAMLKYCLLKDVDAEVTAFWHLCAKELNGTAGRQAVEFLHKCV